MIGEGKVLRRSRPGPVAERRWSESEGRPGGRLHLLALLSRRLSRAAMLGLLLIAHSGPVWPDSVWLDAAGRPNANVAAALQLLAQAPDEGLRASDYRLRELASQATALSAAAKPAGPSGADFERSMNRSLQRYLQDLHQGRVDPGRLGFRLGWHPVTPPDFAALLRAGAVEQRLPEVVASLRPRLAQYGWLRAALQRYRTLADDRALALPLPDIAPARSLQPGDAYRGAAQLQYRLAALGDLQPGTATAGDRYDGALAEGVRRFQARHGLQMDGRLGKATLAALNVPPARRVQQLELAMERLRWMPGPTAQAQIGINIPMFRLWAWDPARPDDAPLEMDVVVGRAQDTRTPVLVEQMHYLVFRPYWNVPRSIVLREILPRLGHDPGYLRRHDMEIVHAEGDDEGLPVERPGDEHLALLREGALRIRQRPGATNSLGLVKFALANHENIYLHGTPTTRLFGRARRDFSHGCIRLADPVALARWLLRDRPAWSHERIEAAMAGPGPLRVDLGRPHQVILFYLTAMAMPSDSTLHFAQDIYGHDARLVRALAERTPGP